MRYYKNMVITQTISSSLEKFVEKALLQANIDYKEAIIDDYDLDRCYLKIDGKEYDIRMWNIDDTGVRYSVLEITGDCGKELYHGFVRQDLYVV